MGIPEQWKNTRKKTKKLWKPALVIFIIVLMLLSVVINPPEKEDRPLKEVPCDLLDTHIMTEEEYCEGNICYSQQEIFDEYLKRC